jgi:hypothetical protein
MFAAKKQTNKQTSINKGITIPLLVPLLFNLLLSLLCISCLAFGCKHTKGSAFENHTSSIAQKRGSDRERRTRTDFGKQSARVGEIDDAHVLHTHAGVDFARSRTMQFCQTNNDSR